MTTETKAPYITVTHGMSGYFAVLLTWNPDLGGFYEPEQTGMGRYRSADVAAEEGRDWAAVEGIEFRYAEDGESK